MSNKINITQQRVITNKDNTFFTNNKITVGSQIPTNGLYEKGDLIVNIGSNNLKEPMWVCVKSGEPGTWEVVGNGSNSGGSNTRMVSLTNNVTISSPTNVVNIGISFNKSTDSLLVFKNGVNVVENIDFTISDDNTQIVNLQGNWNEESLSDYTFTFIVFKNVYVTSDEELSQPDLSDYQQKTDNNLQTSSKELVGAINEINQKANKEVDLSPYQQKTDNNLQTSSKDLVGAINEVFQSGVDVKQQLVDALNASGVDISTSDSWDDILAALGNKGTEPIYILQNKVLNPDYSFYSLSGTSSKFTYSSTNGLYSNYGGGSDEYISINQTINFDNITSIEVKAQCSSTQHDKGYKLWLSNSKVIGTGNMENSTALYETSFVPVGDTWTTQTFDVSSWKGEGYLAITRNSYGGHQFYVSDIKLIGKPGCGLLGTSSEGSSGGLDIIAATELPNAVVNNQIVMLTDTTPSSIGVVSFDLCNPAEGELNVCTTQLDSSNIFTFESNGINVSLPLTNSYQMINGLKTPIAGYYGVNNTWVQFSNGYYPMFENGTYLYDELFGTMKVSSGGSLSITDNNIFARGTMGASSVDMINTKAIDLSKFERVEMTVSISGSGYFYFAVCPSTNFTAANAHTYVAIQSGTYSLDLSSLNGTGYIGIDSTNNTQGTMSITISKIVFY